MKIIDVHVHAKLSDDPLADAEELKATAESYGIGGVCLLGDVLAFGHNSHEHQINQINSSTIAIVQNWPDFFKGMCFLNPSHGLAFIKEEIQRCIVAEGFVGIKLEVDVNARDDRLDPIMEEAQRLDVPVLHHAWYKSTGKTGQESDPSDIAHLARRFPGVSIIMAHLTPCGIRGMLDIQECENVYVDSSGAQPVAGSVEDALRILGPQRILYGSDAPERGFASQLGRIFGADMSTHEREMLLAKNAERLLNWNL